MIINPMNFGPLAPLIGRWVGTKGTDVAPSDDRGTENNAYREMISIEPAGVVQNHEQRLFALKYSMEAWRVGDHDPFHQEMGYWMWSPQENQIMKSFLIPRGVSLIAGGAGGLGEKQWTVKARVGSPVFGISSSPFLDREFQTVEYSQTIQIISGTQWSYKQATLLKMRGKTELFHHTDENILTLAR